MDYGLGKLGENVAGGLTFESFFHRFERWGLQAACVGHSLSTLSEGQIYIMTTQVQL